MTELDRRGVVALSLASLMARPGDLLAEQQVKMPVLVKTPYRVWRTVEYRGGRAGTFFYSNPK